MPDTKNDSYFWLELAFFSWLVISLYVKDPTEKNNYYNFYYTFCCPDHPDVPRTDSKKQDE